MLKFDLPTFYECAIFENTAFLKRNIFWYLIAGDEYEQDSDIIVEQADKFYRRERPIPNVIRRKYLLNLNKDLIEERINNSISNIENSADSAYRLCVNSDIDEYNKNKLCKLYSERNYSAFIAESFIKASKHPVKSNTQFNNNEKKSLQFCKTGIDNEGNMIKGELIELRNDDIKIITKNTIHNNNEKKDNHIQLEEAEDYICLKRGKYSSSSLSEYVMLLKKGNLPKERVKSLCGLNYLIERFHLINNPIIVAPIDKYNSTIKYYDETLWEIDDLQFVADWFTINNLPDYLIIVLSPLGIKYSEYVHDNKILLQTKQYPGSFNAASARMMVKLAENRAQEYLCGFFDSKYDPKNDEINTLKYSREDLLKSIDYPDDELSNIEIELTIDESYEETFEKTRQKIESGIEERVTDNTRVMFLKSLMNTTLNLLREEAELIYKTSDSV